MTADSPPQRSAPMEPVQIQSGEANSHEVGIPGLGSPPVFSAAVFHRARHSQLTTLTVGVCSTFCSHQCATSRWAVAKGGAPQSPPPGLGRARVERIHAAGQTFE